MIALPSPSRLVLSAALLAAAPAAQVPLVGIWNFDETSGVVAADSGPWANHGTLMNFGSGAWGPGRFGGALTFDGVDDHVDVATNRGLPVYEGLGAPFSICLWVKGSAQSAIRVYAESSSGATTGTGPLFTLGARPSGRGSPDAFYVYIRNDGGNSGAEVARLSSTAPVFDDTWHHVAYVDSAGLVEIYVDGAFDSTHDYRINGNVTNSNGTQTSGYGTFTLDTVTLGAIRRGSALSNQFAGSIDQLRVFRFALGAVDVQALYNDGLPSVCRASIAEFGVGCGSGPFDLVAGGSAVLGGPGLQLSFASGTPNAAAFLCWGFGPLFPQDLGSIGFPGCVLYGRNPVCTAVGPLDAAGGSTLPPIAVPNDPALACGQVSLQAAALSAASATVELSDVAVVTLGS